MSERQERIRWESTAALRALRPAPWAKDANCRGLDPNLFYGNNGEVYDELRLICWACPVRKPCLDDALAFETSNDVCGFRGGLGPQARRDLIKERKRRPARAEAAFESLRAAQ